MSSHAYRHASQISIPNHLHRGVTGWSHDLICIPLSYPHWSKHSVWEAFRGTTDALWHPPMLHQVSVVQSVSYETGQESNAIVLASGQPCILAIHKPKSVLALLSLWLIETEGRGVCKNFFVRHSKRFIKTARFKCRLENARWRPTYLFISLGTLDGPLIVGHNLQHTDHMER